MEFVKCLTEQLREVYLLGLKVIKLYYQRNVSDVRIENLCHHAIFLSGLQSHSLHPNSHPLHLYHPSPWPLHCQGPGVQAVRFLHSLCLKQLPGVGLSPYQAAQVVVNLRLNVRDSAFVLSLLP